MYNKATVEDIGETEERLDMIGRSPSSNINKKVEKNQKKVLTFPLIWFIMYIVPERNNEERKGHKMTKKEIMERLEALEEWDFELNQKEEWTEEEAETSEAIFSEMTDLLKKLRELKAP